MALNGVHLLGTARIGQISGGSPDPEGWKILNDTSNWGAFGFDEGANTKHEGRLYFFPGDVVRRNPREPDPLNNSHLVAWTEDRQVTLAADPFVSARGFRLQAVLRDGA